MRKAISVLAMLVLVVAGLFVWNATRMSMTYCPCAENCGGGTDLPCVACCDRACPWFPGPWANRFGMGCRVNSRRPGGR